MSSIIRINLANILSNYRLVHTHLTKVAPNRKIRICASVKANAYGHGMEEVVQYLDAHIGKDRSNEADATGNQECDAGDDMHYWGIASIEEAAQLHALRVGAQGKKGIGGNILCYSHLQPADISRALVMGIELFVGDIAYLEMIIKIAQEMCMNTRTKIQAKVHLFIETGMGRLGIFPKDAPVAYERCMQEECVELRGICSHFSDSSDNKVLSAQQKIFDEVLLALSPSSNIIRHIANSGAIIWQAQFTHYDMVRPGIMLYGASANPARALPKGLQLLPAMQLVGHVSFVRRYPAGQSISYNSNFVCTKDTNIAVVNAGYGDGVFRSLSNKGQVSIGGKKYPIVGNVTMDMIMLNIGDDEIALGTEAIIFGDEHISVDEQASNAHTISYELTTMSSHRPVRKYIF